MLSIFTILQPTGLKPFFASNFMFIQKRTINRLRLFGGLSKASTHLADARHDQHSVTANLWNKKENLVVPLADISI